MYNRYVPNGNRYMRVTMEDDLPKEETSVPVSNEPEQKAYDEESPSSDGPKYTRVDAPTQGQGGNSGDFFPGASMLNGLKLGKLGALFDRDKSGGLGSLLSALKLEELDSGDVLLILIILFLLVEGDNLELVITLGLMLLLGLGDKKEKSPDGNQPSGLWESI